MDFEDLKNPELQERLKGAKTGEELSAIASECGVELSDDELDGISGGSWATSCPKEGCGDYRTSEPCRKDDRHPCYHHGMF